MEIVSDIANFILNMFGSAFPSLNEENRLIRKKNKLLKKHHILTLKLDIKALEESLNEDRKKLKGN